MMIVLASTVPHPRFRLLLSQNSRPNKCHEAAAGPSDYSWNRRSICPSLVVSIVANQGQVHVDALQHHRHGELLRTISSSCLRPSQVNTHITINLILISLAATSLLLLELCLYFCKVILGRRIANVARINFLIAVTVVLLW